MVDDSGAMTEIQRVFSGTELASEQVKKDQKLFRTKQKRHKRAPIVIVPKQRGARSQRTCVQLALQRGSERPAALRSYVRG